MPMLITFILAFIQKQDDVAGSLLLACSLEHLVQSRVVDNELIVEVVATGQSLRCGVVAEQGRRILASIRSQLRPLFDQSAESHGNRGSA